jgi:uncharacterized protein
MVSLSIKVKPGSFKDEINFDQDNNLIIKLREKPIDGAANQALIRFLSKEFKLSKSRIVLEKGRSSQFKKVAFDISPAELAVLLSKYPAG